MDKITESEKSKMIVCDKCGSEYNSNEIFNTNLPLIKVGVYQRKAGALSCRDIYLCSKCSNELRDYLIDNKYLKE